MLEVEIDTLQKSIEKNQAALAQAEEMHVQSQAAMKEEEKELVVSIAAIKNALVVLASRANKVAAADAELSVRASAAFVSIGNEPNTGLFRGQLALAAGGYLDMSEA